MKKKILLVEDDEFIVNMYQTKLGQSGYDVSVALDGQKGLEAVKKNPPDLVLLDILLPQKDGFEVLQGIKGDDNLKNIPVILLTNLGQKEDVDKGIKTGADGYLIKAHFTPSEVVEKIEEVLAK